MDVRVDMAGGVAVVKPPPRLDAPAARKLRQTVEDLFRGQPAPIVVDLREVVTAGSAGAQALLWLAERQAGAPNSLAFAGGPEPLRRMLRIAGIDRLAIACETLDDARRHVAAGAQG